MQGPSKPTNWDKQMPIANLSMLPLTVDEALLQKASRFFCLMHPDSRSLNMLSTQGECPLSFPKIQKSHLNGTMARSPLRAQEEMRQEKCLFAHTFLSHAWSCRSLLFLPPLLSNWFTRNVYHRIWSITSATPHLQTGCETTNTPVKLCSESPLSPGLLLWTFYALAVPCRTSLEFP